MLRLLTRTAVRRGLFGGSRTWVVVGVAAGGARLLRRLTKPQPKVVFCEELQPGQALVITRGRAEPG